MINELILVLNASVIALGCLIALRLGKEALIAFISLLCVLSNFFVIKQITVFGLHATAADAFTVGVFLGMHLLQEYFGKEIAKKAIWICFFCLLAYTVTSQIHLLYTASAFDISSQHFHALLRFTPRLTTASLLVYLFVLNLDRYLYGRLLKKFGHKHLLLRNYALLAFSQLIDTTLFAVLALYGIVHNLAHAIFVSYVVKLVTILISTPFVTLSSKFHKNVKMKL